MAEVIINTPGSTVFNFPAKLQTGMTMRFNVTNTNEDTGYTGTIIKYTVPEKCTIKIEACGSRGAYGNLYTYGITEAARSGNGAKCIGTFNFLKGDELLILVGQHGKDAMKGTSSTKDQTTGAGGGATTIAKRDSTASYKMVGTSTNGSDVYNGWFVAPLIVAAGGNGSRDNGYSSTGTIYNGLGHTTSAQSVGTNENRSGGAFSLEVGTGSANGTSYAYGRSFLSGGLGSMYYYTRSSYAKAGFGGGGANIDDSNGGGGGGWIAGIRGASAQSYINPDGTDISSVAGTNAADGYVIFTVLDTYPTLYAARATNTIISSNHAYVYVNSTLKYKRIKAIYTKNSAGVWVKST